MKYQYNMIEVLDNSSNVAAYLMGAANQELLQCWDFCRMDRISLAHKPGCLGGLIGQKEFHTTNDVVTLRKAK